MLEYQKLMEQWGIGLDNDPNHVLDPAFVSKAKTLEEKIKNNELTDDEIKNADAELVEMFNKLEKEEVDSDELADVKRQKDIAEAKAEIAESNSIELLNALKKKFKDLPEVLPFIDKKLEKFQTEKERNEQEALNKLFAIAKKEIKEIDYDNLQAIGEKYKAYPELVAIVNKRIEDDRPQKEEKELAAKLRTKKEWSYKELQALGVKVTGEDMTVAGVRLEREFLFNIYSIR